MRCIRNRYLLVADLILCFLAYAAVLAVVFPLSQFAVCMAQSMGFIVITAVIYCGVMRCFKLYSVDWIYAGVRDYVLLLSACVIAGIISVLLESFIDSRYFYLKNNLTANFLVTTFLCASRFMVRIIYDMVFFSGKNNYKRTIIIGAGTLGISLLRNIHNSSHLDYNVVGLIDDDPSKLGLRMHGVRVLGNRNDIVRVCTERRAEEIIFAINSVDSAERAAILDICSQTGKKVKILPATENVLNAPDKANRIREINVEDLLEREPITLDNELIRSDISGKVVLVTGGGGSIGSELCRQILKFDPERLVIFDIYENTTFEVQNELREAYPASVIDVLIGSVRDKKRLDEIFDKYRPDLVFHAAAHKHVPLMEDSPAEAIKNNVFGTYNTARCAEEYGVRKFVMISTDKAVNPTNVMGATKRMCEMIVQTLQKNGKTEFVAVRFGNVLGSHGSVIPLFKKQIAEGGPITVTHPEITRFFMTIPEAAQLVLQAASYAAGGEIFVLDMGKPVKIYDLARKMINISGLVPDKDIKIKFTGLRPGEKLYEELLLNEEGISKTTHSKIFVGKPTDMTIEDLNEKLQRLEEALDCDNDKVKEIISEVVPTYKCKSLV